MIIILLQLHVPYNCGPVGHALNFNVHSIPLQIYCLLIATCPFLVSRITQVKTLISVHADWFVK